MGEKTKTLEAKKPHKEEKGRDILALDDQRDKGGVHIQNVCSGAFGKGKEELYFSFECRDQKESKESSCNKQESK